MVVRGGTIKVRLVTRTRGPVTRLRPQHMDFGLCRRAEARPRRAVVRRRPIRRDLARDGCANGVRYSFSLDQVLSSNGRFIRLPGVDVIKGPLLTSWLRDYLCGGSGHECWMAAWCHLPKCLIMMLLGGGIKVFRLAGIE